MTDRNDATDRRSTKRERSHAGGGGRFGFGGNNGGLQWIFFGLVLLMVVVVGRLFYLQIVEGHNLAQAAEDRRTNAVVIQARRGTIYDRRGNVLAMSEECYDVYCNPQEVTDVPAVAQAVAAHLGGTASDYESTLRQDTSFAYLARQANKDASEELRSDLLEQKLSGVYLIEQMRRVYPNGSVGGQILGLVDVDGNGISGLELMYDNDLKGIDGEIILETGRGGTPIAGAAAQTKRPVDGRDLVTAIDIDVQRCIEEQVEAGIEANKATSGFAVVTDPRTGEIIAACSTPYADLTQPDQLQSEALNLKVVSDCYEPGSIAKVLTAAIGLDSKKVEENDYFTVPFSIMVGEGFVYDADDRMDAMEMNLREVLRRSSNVGAAYIAEEAIGAQTFAEGMEAFGIGTCTGVDYPGEADGIVKSLKEYDASTLGNMSFGQGLSIPMMQMVRAVGAIANGGTLMTPHFVTSVGGKDLTWKAGDRAVSQSTAELVADMMKTVVEDGTAAEGAVEGFDVGAKTGTGEIAEKGKYVSGKFLASLIGFAPVQDPQVLVLVGLNETPYLSYSSAGPVFSAIMGEALLDLGVTSPVDVAGKTDHKQDDKTSSQQYSTTYANEGSDEGSAYDGTDGTDETYDGTYDEEYQDSGEYEGYEDYSAYGEYEGYEDYSTYGEYAQTGQEQY